MTSEESEPVKKPLLALTAASRTGITTGKSRMGSRMSRVRVWTDMAESSVPTPTYPIEPSRITSSSPGWNRLVL